MRYIVLQKNISTMQKENIQLKQTRATLETRVSMLRSGSIDKDLLEERARTVLGYRNSGEKDILISH